MKPVRGPSSEGVLVGDEDRLFLSESVVIEILHDNFALVGLVPRMKCEY